MAHMAAVDAALGVRAPSRCASQCCGRCPQKEGWVHGFWGDEWEMIGFWIAWPGCWEYMESKQQLIRLGYQQILVQYVNDLSWYIDASPNNSTAVWFSIAHTRGIKGPILEKYQQFLGRLDWSILIKLAMTLSKRPGLPIFFFDGHPSLFWGWRFMLIYVLVGGWATPLKNNIISWDDNRNPIYGTTKFMAKHKIHGNQTTKQLILS